MNKPLTILIKEAEDQLLSIINGSPLPAVIWKFVLEKYSNSLNPLVDQQYQDDLKRMEENHASEDKI